MKFSLCPYKNIAGKPNTKMHSYRLLDIAIVDVIVVILFGWIISYIYKINLRLVLLILFLSGIIAHRLFCVRTTIDKLIFI